MTVILKEVRFNDGEGLEYVDLNDVQRFMGARFLDGLVAQSARLFADGGFGINAGAMYTLGNVLYPVATGNPREVRAGIPGILFKWTGANGYATPTPADASLLQYYVDTASTLFTLPVGDATHDRIDTIGFKLEIVDGPDEDRDFEDRFSRVKTTATMPKTRFVKLTGTVFAGTPAVSPVRAGVPAGYVPWIDVRVPQTFNSAFTPTTHFVADYRVPLPRFTVATVRAYNMHDYDGGSWPIRAVANGERAATSGPKYLYADCPSPDPGRTLLTQCAYFGKITGGSGAVELVRRDLGGALAVSGADVVLATLTKPTDSLEFLTVPPGTLWDHGRLLSGDSDGHTHDSILSLRFTAGNANDYIRFARFYLQG